MSTGFALERPVDMVTHVWGEGSAAPLYVARNATVRPTSQRQLTSNNIEHCHFISVCRGLNFITSVILSANMNSEQPGKECSRAPKICAVIFSVLHA